MKTMESCRHYKVFVSWRNARLGVVLFFLFAACSAGPEREQAIEIISDHFESRGYRVSAIQIGDIESIPLGSTVYMGSKAYVVQIRSITLESKKMANAQQGISGMITFKDASLRIKEIQGGKGEWVVSDIAGITVP